MISKAIIDIVLKKKKTTEWELNPGWPHRSVARYQLNYCTTHGRMRFSETYRLTVKKLESKIVYYKQTAECLLLIFWPRSQGRVHCHTEKLEGNK
jgi:hypothetical protein